MIATKSKYLTKQDFIQILSNNGEPLISDELKPQIWQLIESLDIPDKRLEEWKKTSLKKLLEHRFSYGTKLEMTKEDIAMFNVSGMYSNILVFINGYFCPKLSRILDSDDILVFTDMQQAKSDYPDIFNQYFTKTQAHKLHLFSALNTYFAANGAFVYIKPDSHVENPIHVYFFSDGDNHKILSLTRNLIVAGQGSKADVLFSYHSLSADYIFTNVVTEIFVNPNATLKFHIFQGEGDNSFQINHTEAHVEAGASFYAHTSTMCGQIVRNDLRVSLLGQDAYAELNGLAMPDREQLHDNTILVKHKVGGALSNQFYRNIIDNNARAIWFGKVLIERGARKSEAHQLNNNILLTPYAKVHAKPHLVIYNDDVAASHGSSTGNLDQEAIFYMRSRGIGERRAKTILLQAFANQVIDRISIMPYRFYLRTLVEKRLAGERVEMLCAKLGECRGQ